MSLDTINQPSYKGQKRFVLNFGYGCNMLVWANHLQDALDECIDWAEDNAPGLLMSREEEMEAYNAARKELGENASEESVMERATMDLTCGGNHGRYLSELECNYVEEPNRAYILRLQDRL